MNHHNGGRLLHRQHFCYRFSAPQYGRIDYQYEDYGRRKCRVVDVIYCFQLNEFSLNVILVLAELPSPGRLWAPPPPQSYGPRLRPSPETPHLAWVKYERIDFMAVYCEGNFTETSYTSRMTRKFDKTCKKKLRKNPTPPPILLAPQ